VGCVLNRPLAGLLSFVFVSCAWAQVENPAQSLVARNGSGPDSTVSPNEVGPQAPAHVQGLPPLPSGKATLIGGVAEKVDHVRDLLVLDIFGGGKLKVLFDERTRVFDGTKTVPVDELKNGERVYVDTVLDGTNIFARNIRMSGGVPSAGTEGQIVSFNASTGDFVFRDTLAAEPVKMKLAPGARILHDGQTVSRSELRDGTLVKVVFQPSKEGRATVEQVSILAVPGTAFAFVGRLEYLDLHRGFMTLVDPRDNASYDVYLGSIVPAATHNLKEGMMISIEAAFDGRRYEAQTLTTIAGPDK
jgi:hypothetical protein